MKTGKKGSAILLSGVMLATTLLSACGSSDGKEENKPDTTAQVAKEGFPIVSEKINLTLMAPDIGIQIWNDMVVLKQMEEMTNIYNIWFRYKHYNVI